MCQKKSTLGKHTNTKHVDLECKENEINSIRLQDLDKARLDKIVEKVELSLTQKVKDINKGLVFSESMLDKFL